MDSIVAIIQHLEEQIALVDSDAEENTVALYAKHVGPPSDEYFDDRILRLTINQQLDLIKDMIELRDRYTG